MRRVVQGEPAVVGEDVRRPHAVLRLAHPAAEHGQDVLGADGPVQQVAGGGVLDVPAGRARRVRVVRVAHLHHVRVREVLREHRAARDRAGLRRVQGGGSQKGRKHEDRGEARHRPDPPPRRGRPHGAPVGGRRGGEVRGAAGGFRTAAGGAGGGAGEGEPPHTRRRAAARTAVRRAARRAGCRAGWRAGGGPRGRSARRAAGKAVGKAAWGPLLRCRSRALTNDAREPGSAPQRSTSRPWPHGAGPHVPTRRRPPARHPPARHLPARRPPARHLPPREAPGRPWRPAPCVPKSGGAGLGRGPVGPRGRSGRGP